MLLPRRYDLYNHLLSGSRRGHANLFHVLDKRIVVIPLCSVQEMSKNRYTISQVRACVKQIVVTAANHLWPLSSDLHIPTRTSLAYGIFLKPAHDVNQCQHQAGVKTCTNGFEINDHQKVEPHVQILKPIR